MLVVLLVYGLAHLAYLYALPFNEVVTSSSTAYRNAPPVATKAAQTFLGLTLVSAVVYLLTVMDLDIRQAEALQQKRELIEHVLSEAHGDRDLATLKHKLDDFFLGHRDLALTLHFPDGSILYDNAASAHAFGSPLSDLNTLPRLSRMMPPGVSAKIHPLGSCPSRVTRFVGVTATVLPTPLG